MPHRKTTLTLLFSTLMLWLSLASAQDLTYTFADGKLTGPETISVNGFQNITVLNNSDVELDVTVAKLRDGATLDELAAADKTLNASFSEGDGGKAMGAFIALADVIGGVHQTPHIEASAYLKLEPGNYVIIASSGGGPDDSYKAVYQAVTVTEGERAEAPAADFTLHMMDFHFDFPETMKAGEQVWEVSNTGSQPHFALIFKLNEGKTAEDVTTWMTDFSGEPPVSFDGGAIIQGVTAGQTFYTPVNLTPGTYVAVCPLPNLASGAPHFVDGMVDTFTVQ